MHHPTDKIAHTTAFVTPVVEQLNGFTMKDRSDDLLHHERTLFPWSYNSLSPLGLGFGLDFR